MRHAVLGAGNLGLDLGRALLKGNEVKNFSKGNGFNYPKDPIDLILDHKWETGTTAQRYQTDHVWVTIGAGSVAGAEKDYSTYSDLHVRLVMELAQKLSSRTFLHVFSTDYVANEIYPSSASLTVEDPLSLYALSKLHMEQLLKKLGRPNTYIYRVGSLYGFHKPRKCFPYNLMKRNPEPCELELPINRVTPTPTFWLAKQLAKFSSLKLSGGLTFNEVFFPYHLAPAGNVSIQEWGQLILGDKYKVKPGPIDEKRPRASKLGGSDESWSDLWAETAHKWAEMELPLKRSLLDGKDNVSSVG